MLTGAIIAGVGFGWAMRYRRTIGLKGHPLKRRFLLVALLFAMLAIVVGAAILLNYFGMYYFDSASLNFLALSSFLYLPFLYSLLTVPMVTAVILLEVACVVRG